MALRSSAHGENRCEVVIPTQGEHEMVLILLWLLGLPLSLILILFLLGIGR